MDGWMDACVCCLCLLSSISTWWYFVPSNNLHPPHSLQLIFHPSKLSSTPIVKDSNTWDLVLRCQKNLRLRNVTSNRLLQIWHQWKFNRGCLVFNCGWDDGWLGARMKNYHPPPAHHPPDGWCLSCDSVCGWTWTWVKIWFHLGNLFWRSRSYVYK